MRVVSLIASATETVCALGLGRFLVGRSHECDEPPWVKRLPALSCPRIDPDASSLAIDRAVRSALRHYPSVYQVDSVRLAALQPDVILTQAHCEVCAVSSDDVRRALAPACLKTRVVTLNPVGLEEVFKDIQRVAEALKSAPRGRDLVQRLQKRMERIARDAQSLGPRPRLALLEWTSPLMCAGNWMPELVLLAGGQDLFGKPRKHSPRLSRQDLLRKDPDIIVIAPCGFDIPRTRLEARTLERHSWWKRLRAVREDRVFLADGNRYFNRPGPGVLDTLEILAEILHPSAFRARHLGSGWRPLPAA